MELHSDGYSHLWESMVEQVEEFHLERPKKNKILYNRSS
jgi:hypothetical protein